MNPRSYLYVPGDRESVLAKAATRGADALIVDLEDGVALDRKETARRTLVAWLTRIGGVLPGVETWVRLNAVPEQMESDLVALGRAPSPTGMVVAKTESVAVLDHLDARLEPGVRLQPLIESARGVLALEEIAAGPRVGRLQLGEADLTADLGMDPDTADGHLGSIRLQVVVASAAAGLEMPVAPVSTDLRDLDRFESSTAALKRMGFGARSTIHPDQVEIVNRVFTPTSEEVARARALLTAAAQAPDDGSAVFVDEDGRMVDEAVLRSARRILARVEEAP